VLSKAAGILKCDMNLCRGSARISKNGYSRPGFADLYGLAVGSGYQSENWRKVWNNLYSCQSAGKGGKGKAKQRQEVGKQIPAY
jgi:hypothetical protein